MKLPHLVMVMISALTLGACGASKDSLCTEHARLAKRMSELIVLGVANPKNFNPTEFKQVTDDLAAVKGKLQSIGSSGAACP